MIMVQDVFRAKYGRGDELVALFKEMAAVDPNFANSRLFTDASGRFFQVMTQMEYASMAAFEQAVVEEFAREEFSSWFARMVEVTESGERAFFHVER